MKKALLEEIIQQKKNQDVVLKDELQNIFSLSNKEAHNMVSFLQKNNYDGDKLYDNLSEEHKMRLRLKKY